MCYHGNKDAAAVPCLSSLGPTRVFLAAVEAHWPARALWTPPSINNATNDVCVDLLASFPGIQMFGGFLSWSALTYPTDLSLAGHFVGTGTMVTGRTQIIV